MIGAFTELASHVSRTILAQLIKPDRLW